jgi:hypothetical protein
MMLAVAVTSCSFIKEEVLPSEWASEVDHTLNAHGVAKIDYNFKYDYTTNKGIKVKSTVPIPAEFLALADEAAQRQVDRFSTMFPEWTWKEISGRHLLVIDANEVNIDGVLTRCVSEVDEPGAPCVYVKGTKAAGFTIGTSPRLDKLREMPPIVVPHQEREGWKFQEWWANTIHNEFEHVSGWKNQTLNPQGVFYYFRGANDIHPWEWATGLTIQTTERTKEEAEDSIHPIK